MAEPVRLVIWDLDDTFWKGTLTEGGIEYLQQHHDIVVQLARRGILSSICSKNDLEPIRRILVEKDIWQYFIFPSINWEPKGPRVAALVEQVQLRPPTILFVDDNPMNRNEVLHFVPDIQVADETTIAAMLDNPLFRGKDDTGLTRLAQYKLLETRQEDRAAIGDNSAFLRASNIRVTIEYEVDRHADRAVELINRTNQLNFTKQRLPEDPAEARAAFLELISPHFIRAGLVKVEDRYGDYGYVGLYVLRSQASEHSLVHYCFSCRTLGMNVETWLYEQLGKPKLQVRGEVLTDLFAPHPPIDWINQEGAATSTASQRLAGRILMRGGCDMSGVAHYLGLNAEEVVGEFNVTRSGYPVRLDHSLFLRYAVQGMSPAARAAALRLGFEEGDFTSALSAHPGAFDVCIFSFWADSYLGVYRHRATGLRVPLALPNFNHKWDIRKYTTAQLKARNTKPPSERVHALLRDEYDFERPSPALLRENLQATLAAIPSSVTLFVLLANEDGPSGDGVWKRWPEMVEQNRVISEVMQGRPNAHLLRASDFIEKQSDVIKRTHFNRMVYFRMYQAIAATLRGRADGAAPDEHHAPALESVAA